MPGCAPAPVSEPRHRVLSVSNQQPSIVVVGAGFAGAATAFHLTRMGMERVTILEQEEVPGMHASGRNAAMVRQVVPNESIAALARGGAAFLRHLPRDWPLETDFEQNGSFLLASAGDSARLKQDGDRSRERGVPAEWWPIERIVEAVPILEGSPAEGGLWCPTDGVVDIHGLLQGYLKVAASAGARLRTSSGLRRVVVRQGKICAVQTESDELPADVVVNAAGAWARQVGQLAGASPVPLVPYRRHLFVTKPLDWVEPQWPIVWDLSRDLYFRPESGGLLLCPCDEAAQEPGPAADDPAALQMLADKVTRNYPKLSDLPIRRSWAGLRTLAPDGRFVVGWDSSVGGFFWLAGLAGHGVVTSYSVGLLAASLVLQGSPGAAPAAFRPGRFL